MGDHDRMGRLDVGAIAPHLGHGRPGAAKLRRILADYDEREVTRAELEPLFLSLVAQAELPRPVSNVMVGDHEVDFLWPASGLVVETDGYAFHRGRDAFEADRRRDADLQAAGMRVMRVTWRQVTREPRLVSARLRAALIYRVSLSPP